MNQEQISQLILDTIPTYLVQYEVLWRMCGSPQYGKGGEFFDSTLLGLVEEGLIVDGVTQGKHDRYPLRAYKRPD